MGVGVWVGVSKCSRERDQWMGIRHVTLQPPVHVSMTTRSWQQVVMAALMDLGADWTWQIGDVCVTCVVLGYTFWFCVTVPA